MTPNRGLVNRVVIERRAPAVAEVRCVCPTCIRLDLRFPGEGYQLAFWPYVAAGIAPRPR